MIRVVFPIFLLLLCSCSGGTSDFHSELKNKDWYCNSKMEITKDTFSDSRNLYKIQIPDSWWTIENLVDTIHGVVSIDSSASEMFLEGIAVTTLNMGGKSFIQYVKSEFDIYTNRGNIDLYEYGRSKLKNDDTYWFLFESQENDTLNMMNYNLYVEKPDSDTCFLLSSYVDKKENWKTKLCSKKKYLYTFQKL